MKTKSFMKIVNVLTVAASLVTVAVAEAEKDERLTLAQTPAAVQATIKQQATEPEIKKIEKEDKDGEVVYEAEIVKGGKKTEVNVSVDGKLISTEEEIGLADAPEAIRTSIETQVAGGKLVSVDKITQDGKTTYEAKVKKGDKILESTIDSSGKVTGTEDVTNKKD